MSVETRCGADWLGELRSSGRGNVVFEKYRARQRCVLEASGEAMLCLRSIGWGNVVFEKHRARQCCVWEASGEAMLCLRSIGRGNVVFEKYRARQCCVWEVSGEAMLCWRSIGRGNVVFEKHLAMQCSVWEVSDEAVLCLRTIWRGSVLFEKYRRGGVAFKTHQTRSYCFSAWTANCFFLTIAKPKRSTFSRPTSWTQCPIVSLNSHYKITIINEVTCSFLNRWPRICGFVKVNRRN
jgi:hypothetical protein